jgi:hypothetical protein
LGSLARKQLFQSRVFLQVSITCNNNRRFS